MGKTKGDAARSKSRPSSSSMAASLLPTGAAAMGFGGYMGSSRVESAIASTSDASTLLDVDGEVALYLKRLSRKDTTTKLKALASLSELIKQKTGKEIVGIMPQWGFEYKKLLLDYSREVRRATHDTMTCPVSVVGRDLAPHLKPLIGPWWFSQFDSVHEVSQAAQRSFQTAFPAPERRLDALMLYSAEIFTYIEENLNLTPQSLSDKATPSDELEEMHQQVISSSLLALAALLDVFLSRNSGKLGSENVTVESKHAAKARTIVVSRAEEVFSTHKYFIDFLKSQSPVVRSAAHAVLKSCIQNIPHAINEGDLKLLAPAILGSFQEKNPACHSSMWEMLLVFIKRFPESWNTVNVQKTILNRLWNFLKNGCFGSQQVSYPALVMFLDTVPPNAITGHKFFLDFFQNLWAGRNPSYSSTDSVAFFVAVEECFIWGLKNVSRYCHEVDAIRGFKRILVDDILLGLLWHEYLLVANSRYQDISLSSSTAGQSNSTVQSIHMESRESLSRKYSRGYEESLGECIIIILSGMHSIEHETLLNFSLKFQADCLDIFQRRENPSQEVDWVIGFLLLLDQHAVQKGEEWPLQLVGPMLKKCFPLIKESESSDAVQLLVVAVSMFGPHKMVQEIMSDLGSGNFVHAFNKLVVPWCLNEFNSSTPARLDLLLTLLEEECFKEQWDAVITYLVTSVTACSNPGTVDQDHLSVLAILMEKARERTRNPPQTIPGKGNWHHELLDSVAVLLARATPPFVNSSTRLLSAVLGGSLEDERPFISSNTSVLILEEVLRKLLLFIKDSAFIWVRDVCSLLFKGRSYSDEKVESSNNLLEMARFALDILNGSIFCLKTSDSGNELVEGILAAIFITDWEYNLITISRDELNNEQVGKVESRLAFGEVAHAFRYKVCNQLLKGFDLDMRKNLGTSLIQSVKYAIFEDKIFDSDDSISSCCQWVLDILQFFCLDQLEEQQFLDIFLKKNDLWPTWVMPDSELGAKLRTENVPIQASKNTRFVSLINKLISEVGFDRVVAGVTGKATSSSTEYPVADLCINQSQFSRPWLAAEILCTWKWVGGSASQSLLPSFGGYINAGNSWFLDSIVNILLDGALVQGIGSGLNLLWPASCDEIDAVEEPFLRALLSLLSTFFQDNIWGKEKAVVLFKQLLDKLYIGDVVNLNCSRILPSVVNILVGPLAAEMEDHANDQSESSNQSDFHCATVDWLRKTVTFPPLNAWQSGEDMEDWFKLIISCFPIKIKGKMLGLEPERCILPLEKSLLYELFQKQKLGSSSVVNKLPLVQMLLSKLMVISVAYCQEDFNEDDWKFLLLRLRFWIEPTVVMMEEIAESVNDVANNSSSDTDGALTKLQNAIVVNNHFTIELATTALVGFSLFCKFVGLQKEESSDDPACLVTRLEFITDRILEGILRLFFCTATAEAIANSCSHEASSVVALSRFEHCQFWELVAACVVHSSVHARDKAVKSIDIWGLSKGAISSLYALLFSCKPLPPLQYSAFVLLSTEPVVLSALTCDTEKVFRDNISNSEDTSPDEIVRLRDEISCKLERLPHEVFKMDLLSHERVNVLVAWGLLLTRLLSLPPSSPPRERLIQYVQNSTHSAVLDCFFEYIPLEECLGTSSRKKGMELPVAVSTAGNAATRAITAGSLLFSMELLWPMRPETMAALTGAIFGLMLHNLPAYVRGWFNDLRDRSVESAIESFTKLWCSPTLISNELSQIKEADFTDESFSIRVSKSAYEVVATYTKDETGMDLVIRLPPAYPLRPVEVACTRSLGITELTRRKWLMSLSAFVSNQNGALAEAIRTWKSNFDKVFEGVEECPICYSVLHTTDHSVPRLACKTCKHKYHKACLYKWFSTSNKSTCPLCQSPFLF